LHQSYISPLSGKVLFVAGEGLFTGAWSDRTRGNCFKLKELRFRLHRRRKFFTLRAVRPWPRLPREAVAAPSLGLLL